MNQFQKRVLGALLAAFLTFPALAGDTWDIAATQKLAKEQGKPILIDFYAVWCGPCKMFDRDSKKNADIKALLGKVVLMKVDAEKGKGVELAKKYEVSAFPTYVLLNQDMQVVNRWAGYSPDFFKEKMNESLADTRTLEQRVAAFKKKPDTASAYALGKVYKDKKDYDLALEMFAYVAEHPSDAVKDLNFQIFETKWYSHRQNAESFSLAQLDQAGTAAVQENREMLPQISAYMMHSSKAGKDKTLYKKHLKTSVDFYTKEQGVDLSKDPRLGELWADAALHLDGNKEEAAKRYAALLPENWQESAEQLNRYAWWSFENEVNLEQARSLAAKGVTLAEEGADKAMILDTQAEIEHVLGNTAAAVNLMEKAVKEHPGRKFYQKQLDRFRKALKEKGTSNTKS